MPLERHFEIDTSLVECQLQNYLSHIDVQECILIANSYEKLILLVGLIASTSFSHFVW